MMRQRIVFTIACLLTLITSISAQSSQTWREELGYGMFAINKGNPNGMRIRTIYRPCAACRGTTLCGNCFGMKMCTICMGAGAIVTYSSYIPCVACGYTGRCGVCHGSGKCVCSNSEYPGYMPGSTTTYGPNGEIIGTDGSHGGSSSSSSSPRSSSSKGSCYKCHGTGVDPASNSGGSLSSWVAYYNNSGNECPYCSSYTSHYHDRCSNCNVPRR